MKIRYFHIANINGSICLNSVDYVFVSNKVKPTVYNVIKHMSKISLICYFWVGWRLGLNEIKANLAKLSFVYFELGNIITPKKIGSQGTRFLMKVLKVRMVGMKSYIFYLISSEF